MLRTRVLPVLAALLLAPAGAGAQGYASAPFQEDPVALAQAAALERIEVAARALAVLPPAGEEGGEAEEAEAEGRLLSDFALVRASLAAASPDLARALGAAMDGMTQAAEAGEDVSCPAAEAITLTGRARAALPAAGADGNLEVRAALIASLLLDNGGVAEAYEEAAGGEGSAYVRGWFALQRVNDLWSGLADQATPEQGAEVEATLAMLDRLFPEQSKPEWFSSDPEEAEGPSQQLVGLLEGVADADLYPARDLRRAAGLIYQIAKRGCESVEVGEGGLGMEKLAIAASYYAGTIQDTLSVLAPAVDAAILSGLEALDSSRPGEAAAVCGRLLAALAESQAALSP